MTAKPQNPNGSGGRDERGRFTVGSQANPGGRPKGLAASVRETYPASELVAGMVKIAKGVKIAGQKPSIQDMVRAREWLADRGYGKAAAFAAIEGEDPLELTDLDRAVEAGAAEVVELARLREARDPGEPPQAGVEASGPT